MFSPTGWSTLRRFCVAHHSTVWQIFGLPSRLVFPQVYQPQNPLEAEGFNPLCDRMQHVDAAATGAGRRADKSRLDGTAALLPVGAMGILTKLRKEAEGGGVAEEFTTRQKGGAKGAKALAEIRRSPRR